MPMNYTSLTASKGVSGSIATWVSYTLLDIPPILDEAQTLLYGLGIRTREMMAGGVFTIAVGQSYQPLPTGFLDPIGRMFMSSYNDYILHKDSVFIQNIRNYTELSGSLAANPFTATSGSTAVNVLLAGHGFNQDSAFNTSGATAFDGVTIAGIFPISAIVDANNFTIDITNLGSVPTGSGTGGGAAVNYLCDNLTQGNPGFFGIWNENFYFDMAAFQTTLVRHQYYKSQPLLSSTNQTNFLTNRYPQLLRTACMTSAADFMKDDTEYQKLTTRLTGLVGAINAENDMQYRGMEIESDTP